MEAIECKYAGRQTELTGGARVVRCNKISEYVGFGRSLDARFCLRCLKGGWTEKAVDDEPELRAAALRALKARFLAGDCPRYGGSVDLTPMMEKIKALAGVDEARALFGDAVERWATVDQAIGGHPVTVIEEKAQGIAEHFGWQSVLPLIGTEKHE